MYSVSLLPQEYRMLHINARNKNIGLLIAMVTMGVLFVVYLILTILLSGKQAEIRGINAENSAVEAQITKLSDIKVVSDEVSALLADTMQAAGTNPDWEQLIVKMGNIVPNNVYLSNINLEYKDNKGTGLIQGSGQTYKAVSDWMKNLENIKGLGEIRCEFSSQVKGESSSSIDFELTFVISQGSGYKLPTEVNGNE